MGKPLLELSNKSDKTTANQGIKRDIGERYWIEKFIIFHAKQQDTKFRL
jgi:hypothetical protein